MFSLDGWASSFHSSCSNSVGMIYFYVWNVYFKFRSCIVRCTEQHRVRPRAEILMTSTWQITFGCHSLHRSLYLFAGFARLPRVIYTLCLCLCYLRVWSACPRQSYYIRLFIFNKKTEGLKLSQKKPISPQPLQLLFPVFTIHLCICRTQGSDRTITIIQ